MIKASLTVLSVIVFVIAFAAVFAAQATLGATLEFKPPYYYAPENALSVINSFFFVFFFSLLFFGYAAPLALGVEAVKYASYFSSGAANAFDLIFAAPGILAALSAVHLGHGVLRDLRGEGSVFDEFSVAARLFIAGAVLLGVLLVAKRFFS